MSRLRVYANSEFRHGRDIFRSCPALMEGPHRNRSHREHKFLPRRNLKDNVWAWVCQVTSVRGYRVHVLSVDKLTSSRVSQTGKHLVRLCLLMIISIQKISKEDPIKAECTTPMAVCQSFEYARALWFGHTVNECQQHTPQRTDQFS